MARIKAAVTTVAVMAAVAIPATGWSCEDATGVVIENTGSGSLVARVGDRSATTVPAGQSRWIAVHPGVQRIDIQRSGRRTVSKTFELRYERAEPVEGTRYWCFRSGETTLVSVSMAVCRDITMRTPD